MKKIVLLCLFAVLTFTSTAQSSDVTFSVIGPHEYALPINFESFSAFVQYGFWNNDNKAYINGNLSDNPGPNQNTFVGFSKYVHFYSLDSIPDVGFVWQIIVPEVSVQGDSFSVNGIADPLWGPAAWIKPSENSTLGIQIFIQTPIGDDDVSTHSWNNFTNIFGDLQLGRWNFDGHAGFGVRSDRKVTGQPDINQGVTYHANLRTAYRLSSMLEPFVALDWDTTSKSKNTETGETVIKKSDETAVGAGLMLHLSQTTSLTMRYSKSIDAKNEVATDAIYIKYAYVW